MKWLKIFENFDNDWYEEIELEKYQSYLAGESDYGQPTSFTPEELGRIKVPSGFNFNLLTNGTLSDNPKGQFISMTKYIGGKSPSKISQMLGPRSSIEYVINVTKYQDDWFVVKCVTKNYTKYYRCDSYQGVNKLIDDLIS